MREEQRKEVVNVMRWIGNAIFKGNMTNAWAKLRANVFLMYGVSLKGKEKILDTATDEEMNMIYNSMKELQKMYNKGLDNDYQVC